LLPSLPTMTFDIAASSHHLSTIAWQSVAKVAEARQEQWPAATRLPQGVVGARDSLNIRCDRA